MQRATIALLLLGGLFSCQSPKHDTSAAASTKPEWSYDGANGPAHWGDLSPAFALANTGKHQSPVDISRSQLVEKDAAPLQVAYQDASLAILNNGHTVEDEFEEGGTLTVDGHEYRLAQFHFHSQSEHTIDGQHAPMEMHLVHKDGSGKLAVIGVMIREGRRHPELDLVFEHMPRTPGRTEHVQGVTLNAAKLLPTSLAAYRYSGSLTTPPCSEEVAWFVLQTPIEASAEQIAKFRKVIHGNNRPTQPLNDRTITATR
jgi:carbonic anhydrase